MRLDYDQVFHQLCEIYIKILQEPFHLLEKMYHQTRHNRSKLLGGREYPDIDMYRELAKIED